MMAVCDLLERLEGLNLTRLPEYTARLREHNICGSVLLTCDLAELKPELAMNFGDWELFRFDINIGISCLVDIYNY